MALRAVSVVNLEQTIRASFDRRITEISRSMREREQNRQMGENRQVTSSTDDITDTRVPEPNAETRNGDPADEIAVVLEIPRNQRANDDNNSSDGIYETISPQTDRRRRESDEDTLSTTLNDEINRLSSDDDTDIACCEFYRSHWMGHFVSGILSGSLFIILGIIFIANLDDFPLYAGLTLIALGIVPCCMAVNRYRYVRLYEQERRRAVRRLNAIRRMHRRNRREGGREQFSDYPPSYDNLGFDGDFEITIEAQSIPSTRSSSSFVLPSYDQFITEEKNIKAKYGSKRHNKDNIWAAIENENRLRKEQSRRQTNCDVIETRNDVINTVDETLSRTVTEETIPGGVDPEQSGGVSQITEPCRTEASLNSEENMYGQIPIENIQNESSEQNEREQTDTRTSSDTAVIQIHQESDNITIEISGNDVDSTDLSNNSEART